MRYRGLLNDVHCDGKYGIREYKDVHINTRDLLRLERTMNLLCHQRGGREGGKYEGGREGMGGGREEGEGMIGGWERGGREGGVGEAGWGGREGGSGGREEGMKGRGGEGGRGGMTVIHTLIKIQWDHSIEISITPRIAF